MDPKKISKRTLYNINVAKVFVEMWSQNWIFVAGSVTSGIAKYVKNCRFQCDIKIIG